MTGIVPRGNSKAGGDGWDVTIWKPYPSVLPMRQKIRPVRAHSPLPASPRAVTFVKMKSWLLFLLVIAVCATTLTWIIRRKVIPRFLANANAEMVADWHAGLTECRQETGVWPDPADPIKFGEQIYIVQGADGRRIPGGYMHGRPSFYANGILFDVYKQPLRVTRDGENLLVASSGPNQIAGDADDVTSDQVQERYRPTTLAKARAEVEARVQKKK